MTSTIFFFLASVMPLLGSLDSEGWVSVPRLKRTPLQESVEGELKWVVYLKDLRKEKFLLRFPTDPKELRLVGGEFEFSSFFKGNTYRLQVFPESDGSLARPGSMMFSEGKWIFEETLLSAHHSYRFQTITDDFRGEDHRKFVNSFEILA